MARSAERARDNHEKGSQRMQETRQQEHRGDRDDDDRRGQKTSIVVNGREKTVSGNEISYEQVVRLGLDPVPTGPNVAITVTYSGARSRPDSGTLTPGHSIGIKKGTRFNVKATDKS
jgi:hypothetical protein